MARIERIHAFERVCTFKCFEAVQREPTSSWSQWRSASTAECKPVTSESDTSASVHRTWSLEPTQPRNPSMPSSKSHDKSSRKGMIDSRNGPATGIEYIRKSLCVWGRHHHRLWCNRRKHRYFCPRYLAHVDPTIFLSYLADLQLLAIQRKCPDHFQKDLKMAEIFFWVTEGFASLYNITHKWKLLLYLVVLLIKSPRQSLWDTPMRFVLSWTECLDVALSIPCR